MDHLHRRLAIYIHTHICEEITNMFVTLILGIPRREAGFLVSDEREKTFLARNKKFPCQSHTKHKNFIFLKLMYYLFNYVFPFFSI